MTRRNTEDLRGFPGNQVDRAGKRYACFARPLQCQRQQQFDAGRPRFGLAERYQLGVLVDRRVVGTDCVDRTIAQGFANRIAVAQAAQRRRQVQVRIETDQVVFGQVQVGGGDIATHRQSLRLGCAHHGDAVTCRQAAEVKPHTGRACQLQNRGQRHRLGQRGNARQAETRGDRAIVDDAAAAEGVVLRSQPDAVAEGGGVFHRPQQHQGVVDRHVGLGEGDAAGLGQLGHLGERLPGEFLRQRADRVDPWSRQVAGAELEHLDQPWLVQRRVGIGRAGKRGDATGRGGQHLGLERGAVFEAGLAQPHRQVDQAGTDD